MRAFAGTVRKWWATPVLLPRWVLTVKYGIFAILGASSGFTGVFDFTSKGFLRTFSIIVFFAALIAGLASINDRFEAIERWACALVVIGMSGAITAAIFATRGPISMALVAVLVLLTLLAVARLVTLLSKLGVTDDRR